LAIEHLALWTSKPCQRLQISLGDTAQTEADVLAHAARCSTGFCIGGYLESEDLVFVLDVNQQYRPWLVERVRLFSAMNTFDGNAKRGLLLIE